MRKKLSKISDWLQKLALDTIRPSSQPPATEWREALLSAGILIALVLVLTSCATKSIEPCVMPPPPLMPALSEPLPSESYSLQVQKAIESWRRKLIAIPLTSER
jgi:hypothetical protein